MATITSPNSRTPHKLCFLSTLFLLLTLISPTTAVVPNNKVLVKRPLAVPVIVVPVLGQPLEAPGCSPQFGRPTWHNCRRAMDVMERDGTHQTTAYFSRDANDALRTHDINYVLQVPRIYSYGDCVIVFAPSAGVVVDFATKGVVLHTAASITATCAMGQNMGGFSRLGINKGLTIALWELPPTLRLYGRHAIANEPTIYDRVTACIRTMAIFMSGFRQGVGWGAQQPPPSCAGLAGGSPQQSSSAPDVSPSDLATVKQEGAHLDGVVCLTEGGAPCGWGYECQQKKSTITDILWGVVQSTFPTMAGYCAESISDLS
ncbi:MAG: hypothetical protein M1836_008088 [Candelina mexicana]|nr:MAG: hypothetical protein M1836_008088 [Candelina mexicana]